MPELPVVTGKQAIKAFERCGFGVIRTSGSHRILKKAGHPYHLTVPVHGKKALGRGLLKSLIDAAGLSVDEFSKQL